MLNDVTHNATGWAQQTVIMRLVAVLKQRGLQVWVDVVSLSIPVGRTEPITYTLLKKTVCARMFVYLCIIKICSRQQPALAYIYADVNMVLLTTRIEHPIGINAWIYD